MGEGVGRNRTATGLKEGKVVLFLVQRLQRYSAHVNGQGENAADG